MMSSKQRRQSGLFVLPPLPPNRQEKKGPASLPSSVAVTEPREEEKQSAGDVISSRSASSSSTMNNSVSASDSSSEDNANESTSPSSSSSSSSSSDDASSCLPSSGTATIKKQRHFLEGIAIDSCTDLLSIPDPPLTEPNSRSSGNSSSSKRRLSVPMFFNNNNTNKPLRDLTNGDDDDDDDDNHHRDNLNVKPSHKRKSLCHVPAPPSDHSFAASLAHKDNESSAASSSATDDAGSSITQRRKKKKRQSIVFPSDAAAAGERQYFQTFATLEEGPSRGDDNRDDGDDDDDDDDGTLTTMEPNSHWKQQPPGNADEVVQTLDEARKLVHAYTAALPSASTSSCRDLLQTMEKLTGYVITPPVNNDSCTTSNDRSLTINKADLFVQLGPDLKRMDQIKQETAKTVQQITACRVDKASNGRTRYYHIPSNRKLKPGQYEERYMLMLDEVSKIRSETWGAYFGDLKQKRRQEQRKEEKGKEAMKCRSSHKSCEQEASMLDDDPAVEGVMDTNDTEMDVCESSSSSSEQLLDDSNNDSSSSGDECNVVNGVLDNVKLPGIHTPTKHDSHEPVSSDDETMSEPEQDEKATEQEDSSHPSDEDVSTDNGEEEDDISFNILAVDVSPKQTPNSGVLLPLPCRDETSTDPEIARAEAKLWKTIDEALETYSGEVLAIRAKRLGQKKKLLPALSLE